MEVVFSRTPRRGTPSHCNPFPLPVAPPCGPRHGIRRVGACAAACYSACAVAAVGARTRRTNVTRMTTATRPLRHPVKSVKNSSVVTEEREAAPVPMSTEAFI